MKYVGICIAIVAMSGCSTTQVNNQPSPEVVETHVDVNSLVSDTPIYEVGRYYRNSDGYYITNLMQKPKTINGCKKTMLLTDLTVKRQDGGNIIVTEVQADCE